MGGLPFQPIACLSRHQPSSLDLEAGGGIDAVGAAARAAPWVFRRRRRPSGDAAGFIAQAAAHRTCQRVVRWRGL